MPLQGTAFGGPYLKPPSLKSCTGVYAADSTLLLGYSELGQGAICMYIYIWKCLNWTGTAHLSLYSRQSQRQGEIDCFKVFLFYSYLLVQLMLVSTIYLTAANYINHPDDVTSLQLSLTCKASVR